MLSSLPVTVTVCAVFQAEGAKVSTDGDAVPSLPSRPNTATVTAAEGRVSNATANVALPPASVARPDTAPTSSP